MTHRTCCDQSAASFTLAAVCLGERRSYLSPVLNYTWEKRVQAKHTVSLIHHASQYLPNMLRRPTPGITQIHEWL